jgi:hypothetical protein
MGSASLERKKRAVNHETSRPSNRLGFSPINDKKLKYLKIFLSLHADFAQKRRKIQENKTLLSHK